MLSFGIVVVWYGGWVAAIALGTEIPDGLWKPQVLHNLRVFHEQICTL